MHVELGVGIISVKWNNLNKVRYPKQNQTIILTTFFQVSSLLLCCWRQFHRISSYGLSKQEFLPLQLCVCTYLYFGFVPTYKQIGRSFKLAAFRKSELHSQVCVQNIAITTVSKIYLEIIKKIINFPINRLHTNNQFSLIKKSIGRILISSKRHYIPLQKAEHIFMQLYKLPA